MDVKLKCKKAKNDTTSRQIYTVPYRYLTFCKLLHHKSLDLDPEPYIMNALPSVADPDPGYGAF